MVPISHGRCHLGYRYFFFCPLVNYLFLTIWFSLVTSIFFINFLTWYIFFLYLSIIQLGIFFLVMLPFTWLFLASCVTGLIVLTSIFLTEFRTMLYYWAMNLCLLVTSSFKKLFSSSNNFILFFRVVASSVLILQSCVLFTVVLTTIAHLWNTISLPFFSYIILI